MSNWIVGAGSAVVELTSEYFPTAEKYIGVHEDMVVRALYIEKEEKALIVTLEQTSIMPQAMAGFKAAAMEKTGLDENHIWIVATHTFGVPHIWNDDAPRLQTDDDRRRNAMMRQSFTNAVAQATEAAICSRKEAKLRFLETTCNINISRDLPTADGYWLGNHEKGLSDKSVAVIKAEGLNGETVAIFFNYGMQSAVMHKCPDENGYFLMSGDVASAACRYLEREYGVPAIFCVGACGDQVPCLQTASFETDRFGKMREIRVNQKTGFAIVELLGARLGAAVVTGIENIKGEQVKGTMKLANRTVECPAQKMLPIPALHATKNYEYIPQGTTDLTVEMISLGDVTLIGAKPEMTSYTALHLKANAPGKVVLCNMVNGAGKYMAHDQAYADCMYAAMNSRYGRGGAEIFEKTCLEMLESLKH